MTSTPVMLRVAGRDIQARHPDAWPTLVGQVGGALLTMPCPWRWVTLARPARLTQREQQLRDALALATDAQQRQRLQSDLLFYGDLARAGLMEIEHRLLIWTADPVLRATLPERIGAACGRATVLERWTLPMVSPLAAQPDGLQAADGTIWRGLLAQQIHNCVLPTLWRTVLGQPWPLLIVIDVHTDQPAAAQVRLETARMQLEAHTAMYQAFHQGRANALRDWHQASSLVSDGNLLHDLRVALWVQGGTVEEARTRGTTLQQALAGTIELIPATAQHHALVPCVTPQASAAIQVRGWTVTTQTTPQVATVLPVYLTSLQQEQGVLFGVDRQRNAPLLYAIDRLDARNACFFGWTGSGKSSYVAVLAHRHIQQAGYQAIVVDPQGAFAPLAAAYPGSYHRIALGGAGEPGVQINPLDLVVAELDSMEGLLQQTMHVETILGWLYGQPWTPPESASLQTALATLYRAWWATGDQTTPPRLSDLVTVLQAQADGAALAALVGSWTGTNPLAAVLDRPTSLDLRLDPAQPLVVYDVADPRMPERLKHAFMLLITSAIQRAVRTQPRKCLIVIDEAGILFNDPLIARFAETLAKTIRRFGGALWMVDQTLNLLTTRAGDEVFQNSAIVALGTLQLNQHTLLEQTFPQLTPAQIGWITGTGLTDDERMHRRGQFVTILNGAVYPLYNTMASEEWTLIARSAMVADAAEAPGGAA